MQTIHIDSLDELPHAAAAVINALEGRSVVVFRGEMGAGKTTLIREIVARLGADDTVTSPTFAIVNQYTTREGKNIYHFDFYRINRLEEAYDFGYEEYFYSGDLCLVEWPEKIEELLPEEVMTVRIAVDAPTVKPFQSTLPSRGVTAIPHSIMQISTHVNGGIAQIISFLHPPSFLQTSSTRKFPVRTHWQYPVHLWFALHRISGSSTLISRFTP